RCNILPTTTCVLCYAACESVDHLFILCRSVQPIWNFFLHLFGLPEISSSVEELWGMWWPNLGPRLPMLGSIIIKAVVWNVWLSRNDCMFNDVSLPCSSLISKVAHVLILWFYAAIRRSLAFQEQTFSNLTCLNW
ncbi:hypothetical protein IHE45_08G078400, partial [Dioscorea alata]